MSTPAAPVYQTRLPELPIIGERHFLKLQFRRVMFYSAGAAAFIHLAVLGGWIISKNMQKDEGRSGPRIVQYVEMGVPPSLSNKDVAAVNLATQVTPPSIGVPEPVPDFQAPNTTLATTEEMASALEPMTMTGMGGDGDSIVVNLDANSGPSPDDFVAYEEAPVLINMPAPEYPEMARAAEVDGLVKVQVQIGKDGKVKDAIVLEGHQMLNDAAIAAAKRSTWRPALQQHKPVEVWVVVPLRFSLH